MASLRLIIIAVLSAALLTIVVSFPLSLAVSFAGLRGVAAEGFSGTIWSGSATGLKIAGFDMGKANMRTSVTRLILGKPPIVMRWQSPTSVGKARADLAAGRAQLSEVDMRLTVNRSDFSGVAALSDGVVDFDGDRCARASGTIVFNPADGSAPINGVLTCKAGALTGAVNANGLSLNIPIGAPS